MEDTLYNLIRDDFKIDISDLDYERLCDTLSMYDVQPTAIHIDVHSNLETFMNNIQLMKKIDFRRAHTHIELEDVIYYLHPMTVGCYEKISTIYPSHFLKTVNRDIPRIDEDLTQQLCLVRTLKYETRGLPDWEESYTLMAYSNKLTVRAGIRFEKIEK